MIFILLIVFIAMIILGQKFVDDCNYGGLATVSLVTGIVGTVVGLIVPMALMWSFSEASTIDKRIAMYEAENAKIETQIVDVVNQYQQYEKEIFTEVTPDSAITLVSLYPELKSDALVLKQIEVYVENNEKIKSLNEEKITSSVVKWWLYFGGE